MDAGRLKLEKVFSGREELAAFLRDLADRIEGRDVDGLLELDPESLAKLRVGVKNREGEYVLKFKAKAAKPEALCPEGAVCVEEPGVQGSADDAASESGMFPSGDAVASAERPICDCRPKYSRLKKRMKASFRDLRRSVEAGELPDADMMELFLSDSDLMVTYEGKGDEFYVEYSALCRELQDAFSREDQAAFASSLGAVTDCMRRCHDRYK